ncbi:hypothetical protein D1P53_001223 [Cryptococcus gattii VGV]|nr:hypothetical protein D1P53_001223 [Cryptococcus gattii VGV]
MKDEFMNAPIEVRAKVERSGTVRLWEMGNLKADTVKEYSQIFLRILLLLLNINYVFRPLILPTGGPMSQSTDEWKSWREAMPGWCVPKDAEESQRRVSEAKGLSCVSINSHVLVWCVGVSKNV